MSTNIQTLADGPRLNFKEGDTLPAVADTILDREGDPVDLTGASVRFYMEYVGDDDDGEEGDTLVVNAAATVTDATAGEVAYQLQASDTARTGRHEAEWVVTTSGGGTLTYPRSTNLVIDVAEPLAREGTLPDDPLTDATVARLTADAVTVREEFTPPEYASTDDAPAVEGSVIYVPGSGVFVHDGTGYTAISGGGGTDTDSRVNIAEGGTVVAADATTLDFDIGDFDVSTDGSGGVTVAVSPTESGGIDVTESGISVVTDATELDFNSADFDVSASGGVASILSAGPSDDTHIDVQEGGTALASDIDALNIPGDGGLDATASAGVVNLSLGALVDATHLGGNPAVDYPQADAAETITGNWDFTGSLRSNGSPVLDRDDRDAYVTETASFPYTTVADGDYIAIPHYLAAGETLNVYGVGARTTAQATPAGLTVGVYDVTNATEVHRESTSSNRTDPWLTPLATVTGVADVELRIWNASGAAVDAGGFVAYIVE